MLHAYRSSRVRIREIRTDPISPTVFEKKKNMAAETLAVYNLAADKAKVARVWEFP
jgi:hypothetical protein